MRPASDVHQVFRLAEQGLSQVEIARRAGVSRATVRDWLGQGEAAVLNRPMRIDQPHKRCDERCSGRDLDEPAYAYLLAQYLGDGCISPVGSGFRLRLGCCNAYPEIMAECATAIRSVLHNARVGFIGRPGCTEVYSTWFHWPCLLPHGEGAKHKRTIALAPWQQAIALDRHPDQFVRGLVHSDGCRCINRVKIRGRTYEYIRYFFTNESLDIQGLFLEACDRLGIAARPNKSNSISVARREAVVRMDAIVGPKR